MTTLDDNEAFRLEFVNRMATVLGMPAPPKPAPILKTVAGLPRPPVASRAASHRLLAAVHSAKGEIEQLRHIIERYEALASELSIKGHDQRGPNISLPQTHPSETKFDEPFNGAA